MASLSQERKPGSGSSIMKNSGAPGASLTRPLIASAHFGEVMTTLAPQSFTM